MSRDKFLALIKGHASNGVKGLRASLDDYISAAATPSIVDQAALLSYGLHLASSEPGKLWLGKNSSHSLKSSTMHDPTKT